MPDLPLLARDSIARVGGSGAVGADAFGRVAAVSLLQDVSELAIADAMTQEILLFNLNGTYLASRGRKGSGPGEFRAIRGLASLPGGALGVWDAALERFALLAQDGTVRPVTIGPSPGDRGLLFIGALPDGRVLLRFDGSMAQMRSRSPGIAVDTVVFALYDAAGHDADTAAVFWSGWVINQSWRAMTWMVGLCSTSPSPLQVLQLARQMLRGNEWHDLPR